MPDAEFLTRIRKGTPALLRNVPQLKLKHFGHIKHLELFENKKLILEERLRQGGERWNKAWQADLDQQQ